jgi:hypothetical protein
VKALERAVLLALFVGGGVAWATLLSADGRLLSGPAPAVEDWPKEFRYVRVLQQAVQDLRLPLYVSRPILSGRKLLAVPELNCAPHVLLLRWLPPATFLAVDALLFYALGFAGLLLLRRRYGLGLLPFALLALVFFFNGHLVAHLGVGHSMWAAHFLLPFFVLLVLEMVGDARPRTPVLLALVLFAVLLRGGIHLFAWCVLFLLLLGAFNPRRAKAVLAALAWAAALGAVRLLPAAFLARHREQAFLSGYPSLLTLGQALSTIRDATEPLRGGFFGQLGWWEYDSYLGPLLLLWLLVCGLAWSRQAALPGAAERGLWGPMAVLAALACGDSYLLLNLAPLPLLNAERVSARLLILPLVFLAAIAALRLQGWLARVRAADPRWMRAAPALGLLVWLAAAAPLALHAAAWRMTRLQQIVPPRRALMNVDLAPLPPLVGDDGAYVALVGVAAAVSVAALLAAAWTLRYRSRPAASASTALASADRSRT